MRGIESCVVGFGTSARTRQSCQQSSRSCSTSAVAAELYVDSYRRYCWPVRSLSDLKLAPFHLLATESAVHVDKDHTWHMEILARVCREDDELLLATPYLMVDATEPKSQEVEFVGGKSLLVAVAKAWLLSRLTLSRRDGAVSYSRP